jgi:hypothetical protein
VPNFVLLTGAGFSKNWGGLVAREITNALMSQLQNNPYLLQALNRGNFEDVLSQVQSEYLATRNAENQNRLNAMQGALSDMFGRMNAHFAARQFEFSNDIAHSIQKFLVRFDAIFTLNQDLLIEVHYNNQNVALWHGTRWQGYELPGLRELPLEDPMAGRVRSIGLARISRGLAAAQDFDPCSVSKALLMEPRPFCAVAEGLAPSEADGPSVEVAPDRRCR